MKKQILSLLLSLVMVLGLLPAVAFAAGTDKAIMLGTGGISGYAATNSYDYIYFGNWTAPDNFTTSGPIKWRVLDTKTNMANAKAGDGLFLLSDVLLGTRTNGSVKFDNSQPYSNAWQGNTAQAWCKDFAGEEGATNTVADAFTATELGAILATTKSDMAFTSSTNSTSFAASNDILNGDKVFFLSAEEAENKSYGFTNDSARVAKYGERASWWWLRSPHATNLDLVSAGTVLGNGQVSAIDPSTSVAVRPAFNLDLNSVLFTSAAEGGKSAEGMDNGLTAIADYTGNDWKLTLKDYDDDPATNLGHDGFVAATTAVDTTTAGGDVSITYTGAAVGKNEYVSAMLVDSSDNVLYYGRLKNVAKGTDSEGTVTVAIPSGLVAGTYTLKVFSEQCNGDYKTDYASAFQTVVKITPTLTLSANSGTVYSNAGTTSFTYTYDGDGTVSAVSSDEKVAAVSVDTENKTITATILKAGKATITVSAAEGTNYTAAEEQKYDLMVKQYVVPSYDDDEPTYSITVNEAEHGTVTSSRRYAERGENVTLTVEPDKGWTLETLTVTDQNGDEIDLDIVEIGEKYTFKMPSGKVTVTATFMEDNTMLNYFVDVNAQDYFYDAVLWAAENGMTYGVDDSHFAPNEPCTRAQIVTFLWRAAGSPEPKSLNSFTDVAADSYCAKAVAWAVERGITSGTGNGRFSQDEACTRAQAVTFLYRAAGSPAVSGYAEFDDVMTDAYYAGAVAWATEQGVTEGVGNRRFAPDDTCTRGQIVTFLWRSQVD